jgi:hypothetical protein
MKAGGFYTTKQCKTSFILHKFYSLLHHYDLTIICDLMSELRIVINFNDQTMMWDESTIKMRDYEMLLTFFASFYSYLH